MNMPTPISTLFPYTTLFRSAQEREESAVNLAGSYTLRNLINRLYLGTEVKPRNREVNIFNIDRKSTRLNSSHSSISYAVFCLKKKRVNNYTCYPRQQKLYNK